MQNIFNDLFDTLISRKLKLVIAESCTGGLFSENITRLPGSSKVFERGFVTYSNEAKIDLLNIPSDTIRTHGAVSQQTAKAMAQGALENSCADISLSITGIAGPDGGTKEKPLGLVFIGMADKKNHTNITQNNFEGDRQKIRAQTVRKAALDLIRFLKETN